MNNRRKLYFSWVFMLIGFIGFAQKADKTKPKSDREVWLYEMDRMVRPVLQSLANDSLKIRMPNTVSIRSDNPKSRIKVQYVEVLGRVLQGIAPWLQLEGGSAAEVELRNQYRQWVLKGLSNSLDSTKNDYMRYDLAGQQLVDASFIALALIRAPWIWENLSQSDQTKLAQAIRSTRQYRPGFNNWLLFSAMNEAFLAKFGMEYDIMRIDYALQQHEQWYVGDGIYNDGPAFAFDYYNSYVIHPYLIIILEEISKKTSAYNRMKDLVKKRNERYAVLQERMIAADGSFPPIGRSLIYRTAAFHHLADMAWRQALPDELSPGQVRSALTAMLTKTLNPASTYQDGWMTLGLYGNQPHISDSYNNQGSPYLAAAVFLPLGLPETNEFWSAPAEKWTQLKVWTGEDVENDYKVDLRN